MKSDDLFILLIFGVSLISLCEGDRGSYGDSCNKTNRCDSQSSLSCIENKCQCVKPNEMIYDESAKKCRILSGEKCFFTLVEGGEATFGQVQVRETFDCVENAVCNETNGYCSCMSDHYEDTQGICRNKRSNGENCTKDDECSSYSRLMCKDGFCSCNQTEAVFNGAQCVVKAGLSCIEYGACVPNAECYNELCTCRNEYEKSEDGLCLGKYDQHCDANVAPCLRKFSCINSVCSCHYPQHQEYDPHTDQCVSHAQGPCLETVNGSVVQFQCIENAECKTQDGISECICSDGYINSYDGKCYIAHGQPCVTSNLCDPMSDLICKNGTCACKDLHVYDESRSLCIGLVGAKCFLTDNFCVTGSSCQSIRFNLLDWSGIKQRDRVIPFTGSCRCSQYYVPNAERKCVFSQN